MTQEEQEAMNGALLQAALKGDARNIGECLNAGAQVEAVDGDGWRPLHNAAWSGNVVAVLLLIRKGAKVDAPAPGRYNMQPLHIAAERGHGKAVELLIGHGAKADAADSRGRTPFHRAAGNGLVVVADFLLQKGAQLDRADMDGVSPLHRAAENGHEVMVGFLLEKGADPTVVNNEGKKPIDLAVHPKIKALLEKAEEERDPMAEMRRALAALRGRLRELGGMRPKGPAL